MLSDFWSVPKTEVLNGLRVDSHHGLSRDEARARATRHGLNQLRKKEGVSRWALLAHQLNSPFVYILLAALVISWFEHQLTEATVIGVVVIINTAIGFLEEYRAETTINKLRTILAPTAKVIRESVEQKIPARLLVPGDIILVEAGDRVPADARILEARSLRINQAPLTGESIPAHKRDTIISAKSALIDRQNVVYMSTLVVAGQATAVVVKTGMATELGAIAAEVTQVKDTPSDLERKLKGLGRTLTSWAIILAVLAFVIGSWAGIEPLEMLRVTLALLVSIVPEGLPIALTVTLSVGLTRIFRHHALIRRLSAVETLGSITTLCIDKTGTLTEGAMMVEKILLPGREYRVSGRGFGLNGAFFVEESKIDPAKDKRLNQMLELVSLVTMSTISKEDLRNDQAKQLTDPTETALAVVAAKAGFYAFEREANNPEILELPFDQELRYSASVHKFGSHYKAIVKGSIERITNLSSHVLGDAKARRLLKTEREQLLHQAELLASQGYRVVALAVADYPRTVPVDAGMVKNLTFLGFLAMTDPIRPEARSVIARALESGIRTVMITGDHLLTAQHIARKVGLDTQGEAVHSQELGHHSLEKVSVIARATPKDKLVIVERLQKRGELVVMTGDGVNDAPALKKADIGVAMGRAGSDIAIETAEMVLLDDNIAGILAAIGQGRLIWENIRKVVYYLVSTNLGEVIIIVLALGLNWPLPVLVVQILWLNLVTDGVTSMALTVEPAEENLMHRPPRHPKDPIINRAMVARMIAVSLLMAAGTLMVFWRYMDDLAYARTAALTTLIFFQLFNLFNSRSALNSVFVQNWLSNRWLIGLFLLAAGLQLLAIYYHPVAGVLGLVPLAGSTLVFCITCALSIILLDELGKLIRSSVRAWVKAQSVFN